ncbi:MAG TPA: hypothetical protein VMD28_03690, partial [Acidimicrobiales bacterium]|nr:hypothetical protein [Acidimicrobiales bacterium]
TLLHDVSIAAGLDLGDDDIAVAVRKGRGSARDALSALDQVVASGSAEALRPDVTGLTEAVATEDARQALVSVAALHESGWGPQQIATELVDDLRQAFLVALAPELCAAAGSERERLADRAARLGLARVVRAIEALGHAQVDMRDAPDPRAVLEVTLVRLARPELDDSATALLDRIAHLEQALAGNALAAVRAAPQGASPAGAGGPGPAPPTSQAPATTPLHPGPSAPSGSVDPPASATGPPASATALEERPGLGALRRQRAARREAAPGPSTAEPHGSEQSQGGRAAVASAPRAPSTTPAPPEPAPTASAPAAGSRASATDSPAPDRDRIVEAWGDYVLRGLPARAKALFSAGRFVSVEGRDVTYALPNAAHRERCEDVRAVVEQAIASHFSTPITLVLTVDESSTSATTGASPADAVGGGSVYPDDEADHEIDPNQPSGSPQSVAEARLLEAFPGAQEV